MLLAVMLLMQRHWSITLVVLSMVFSAVKTMAHPNCDSKGICSLTRTVLSDDGRAYDLTYRFKYRPATRGAPTVVFIPGGPGQGSTDQDPAELGGGMPADFGVILTDPRFVGINADPAADHFRGAMTSAAVANDVLAAVDSTGVKNYILYGHSYGTVPATIAAAKSGRGEPLAVVLEGTVAHNIKQADYDETYFRQWQAFVKDCDGETFQKFQDRIRTFIAEDVFSANEIGDFIQALMIQRHSRGGRDYLHDYVNLIANESPANVYKKIRPYVDQMNQNDSANGYSLFHAVVNCKEVFADGNPDTSDFSFNGQTPDLKPTGVGNCKTYVRPTDIHLYDSKNFQIRAPVFYIQGGADPATPPSGALYHFQHQKKSNNKYFYLVANAGHLPLKNELGSCSRLFWAALAVDINSALGVLQGCQDQMAVKSGSAQ